MDLKNAFGSPDIHSESAYFLANELSDGLSPIYLQGMFGWMDTLYWITHFIPH